MSATVLDAQAIRCFASPAGALDKVVVALRKKQYLRTISGLTAIRDTLDNDSAELSLQTGFSDAVAYVGEMTPELQREVLGYPSIAFWVEVALDLLRRRAHVKFPELHIESHLESFGRCALAAAVIGKGSHACVVRTDSSGGVFFPGANEYCAIAEAQPFERVCIEVAQGHPRVFRFGTRREYAAMTSRVPEIGGLPFNVLDEDLRLPGRYDFHFDLPFRDADTIRWSCPLEESQQWIAATSPLLASEINTAVRAVIAVRSQSPDVHISATFREAPGLMALSWTPDTPVLAEALVHEYHHGKLNTLLAADPLVVGPTQASVFYSPWRPDPRPLLGVLHGAFVFHAVLDFWIRFLEAGIPILHESRLRQRLCLLSRQTREALETLSGHAHFTQCGSILVRHLTESTNVLDAKVSLDSGVIQRVENRMASHRARWQQQHDANAARPNPTTIALPAESPDKSSRATTVSIEKLSAQFPADDPVIEDLARASDEGQLASALEQWVYISSISSEPTLEVLARAHAAYVEGTFADAAARYSVLTQRYPSSRYFWQCLGHCLRHLGQIELGTCILTNLGKLSAEARPESGDVSTAFDERTQHASNLLAVRSPG